MNKKLLGDIIRNFESKTTDDLLEIWKEKDRYKYSETAFEAVQVILKERNVPIPESKAYRLELNDTIQGLDAHCLDDLQKASNYIFVGKLLRKEGFGQAFWGAIAIFSGIVFGEDSKLNMLLVLLGIALLIQAYRGVFSPSPKLFKTDGIVYLLIGVWNIVISIINIISSDVPPGSPITVVFMGVGMTQIGFGLYDFKRATIFSNMPEETPSENMTLKINDIVNYVSNLPPEEVPNMVEVSSDKHTWKTELNKDFAVFVEASGQDAVFVSPRDVDITAKRKSSRRKNVKVMMKLPYRKVDGVMKSELFSLFNDWKNSVVSTYSSEY